MAAAKRSVLGASGASRKNSPAPMAIKATTPMAANLIRLPLTGRAASGAAAAAAKGTDAGVGALAAGIATGLIRGVPHSSQKRASATLLWPHWVQNDMCRALLQFEAA